MAAYEAVQKALAPGATEGEQAYIHALAKRYSSDPKVDLRKLDADYARAMRDVYQWYPDDLDAATLYAESLMDLHPSDCSGERISPATARRPAS